VGWRQLKGIANQIHGAIVRESERKAELPGGGWFQVRSADQPDSLRGEGLNRVVMDECAFIAEAAWSEAIRPALSDRKGDALFISTPKGHNWFWRHWTKGEAGEPGWQSWRFPSLSNPFLDPAEIESARSDLPERVFDQEYLAEFLDDAGGVFRGVRGAIDAGRRGPEPRGGERAYVAGVDLAKYEDFTVVSVLEVNGSVRDGSARQVYVDRFNRMDWPLVVGRVKAACDRYDAAALVDSTGVGDPIFEQLRKAGVRARPYLFTNASKEDLINNLSLMFERGRIRLLDDPTQTAELTAFQYELTPSRNVRMGAPQGMHDDTVIALALAAWQCGTGRKEIGFYL
jgi:phage FluMu gp28-like protein